MTLEHIANGLIGNLKPEIGQGAHNPIIAPVPVLRGHANNQLLKLSLDARSARTSTGLRSIEFAGDKLAVPGQDSVRLRHRCDLGKNLAAQAMTDLAERGSLDVRELQPPVQLGLQDAVFGGQIFVPRQQLLVHRPGDVGQDARPIHNGPLTPIVRDIIDRPKKCTRRPPATLCLPSISDRLLSCFSFLTLRHRADMPDEHFAVNAIAIANNVSLCLSQIKSACSDDARRSSFVSSARPRAFRCNTIS